MIAFSVEGNRTCRICSRECPVTCWSLWLSLPVHLSDLRDNNPPKIPWKWSNRSYLQNPEFRWTCIPFHLLLRRSRTWIRSEHLQLSDHVRSVPSSGEYAWDDESGLICWVPWCSGLPSMRFANNAGLECVVWRRLFPPFHDVTFSFFLFGWSQRGKINPPFTGITRLRTVVPCTHRWTLAGCEVRCNRLIS